MSRDRFLVVALSVVVVVLGLSLFLVLRGSKVPQQIKTDSAAENRGEVKSLDVGLVNQRYFEDNAKLQRKFRLYRDFEITLETDDYDVRRISTVRQYFELQHGHEYGPSKKIDEFRMDGTNLQDYWGRVYEDTGETRLLVVEHKKPERVPDSWVLIWGLQWEKKTDQGWVPSGSYLYRYAESKFLMGVSKDGKQTPERVIAID